MPIRHAVAAVVLLAAAVLAAGCGSPENDLRTMAADVARNACRAVDGCSMVCADGTTLDGRQAYARCRR